MLNPEPAVHTSHCELRTIVTLPLGSVLETGPKASSLSQLCLPKPKPNQEPRCSTLQACVYPEGYLTPVTAHLPYPWACHPQRPAGTVGRQSLCVVRRVKAGQQIPSCLGLCESLWRSESETPAASRLAALRNLESIHRMETLLLLFVF